MMDDVVKARSSGYGNPLNGKEWFDMRWHDAIFEKDFGPWSTGDLAYTLVFCPITGVISQIDQDGYIVQTCKVELKAHECDG